MTFEWIPILMSNMPDQVSKYNQIVQDIIINLRPKSGNAIIKTVHRLIEHPYENGIF